MVVDWYDFIDFYKNYVYNIYIELIVITETKVSPSFPKNYLSESHWEEFSTSPETVNAPGAEVYELNERSLGEAGLDELPRGYAYIGGSARAVALQELCGHKVSIRDVDIIGVTEYSPDGAVAERLTRQYMPDDARYGYGVKIEGLSEYFSSRDFTINEVMVVNGMLMMTRQAREDITSKTLRPSIYEGGTEDEPYPLNPKLAIKGLLLASVFEEELAEHPKIKYEMPDDVRSFYLALALDKSSQYSDDIRNRFLANLYQYGFIEESDLTDDIALAVRLSQESGEGGYSRYEYRGSAWSRRVEEIITGSTSERTTLDTEVERARRFAYVALKAGVDIDREY